VIFRRLPFQSYNLPDDVAAVAEKNFYLRRRHYRRHPISEFKAIALF
jgi:hypothetical protein